MSEYTIGAFAMTVAGVVFFHLAQPEVAHAIAQLTTRIASAG